MIDTLKNSLSTKDGQTKVFRINDKETIPKPSKPSEPSSNDIEMDQQTQSSSSTSQIGNEDAENNEMMLNNCSKSSKKSSIDLDYSSEPELECIEILSDTEEAQNAF